jgi:hypothetical protein
LNGSDAWSMSEASLLGPWAPPREQVDLIMGGEGGAGHQESFFRRTDGQGVRRGAGKPPLAGRIETNSKILEIQGLSGPQANDVGWPRFDEK